MTTLDDLLAADPTVGNAALACLGTTRTNEQCGVSTTTTATSNVIVHDLQKQKEEEKRQEKTAAAWKKVQRNAQRRRKIAAEDDDLEYLARLYLCPRHRRSSQIKRLLQRIKADITAHNGRLTGEKPSTAEEMDPESASRASAISRALRTAEAMRDLRAASTEGGGRGSSSGHGIPRALSWSDEPRPVTRRRMNQTTSLTESTHPGNPSLTTATPRVEHSQVPYLVTIGGEIGSLIPSHGLLPSDAGGIDHWPLRRRGPSQESYLMRQLASRQIAREQEQERQRLREHSYSHSHSQPQPQARPKQPIEPGDECPVCLEKLSSEQELVWCREQCGNNFHRACIVSWFDFNDLNTEPVNYTCPVCRVAWGTAQDWDETQQNATRPR